MSGNILSVTAAKRLTARIRNAAEQLWQLVVEAYQGRAWEALGYANWDTYCQAEFGDMKIKLPPEDRREIMQHLRDHGLSLRAISSATGYDKHTVSRDLVANVTGGANAPHLGHHSQVEDKMTSPRKEDSNESPKTGEGDTSTHFWKTATSVCKLSSRVAALVKEDGFSTSKEIKEAGLRDLLLARAAIDVAIAALEGAP